MLGNLVKGSGLLILITPWWLDVLWMGRPWPYWCAPDSPYLSDPDPAVNQGSLLSPAHGMDVMCQHIRAAGLPTEIAAFVALSVRGSSLRTYESVWQAWASWCETHGVDEESPSKAEITCYLWFFLQDKGLAAATLGGPQGSGVVPSSEPLK